MIGNFLSSRIETNRPVTHAVPLGRKTVDLPVKKFDEFRIRRFGGEIRPARISDDVVEGRPQIISWSYMKSTVYYVKELQAVGGSKD
ncbi:hypothetical protein EVAR_13932_1 [Eumeta japonica]|uniref:Uncharacterized protein n=1 Tax=Eumeta variegata TaxID=151549 RepID=A0A4C1U8D8_EUMVA|nr:hypothetical protein EVAR_13932_1 [Eumeta japonica]